MTRVCPACNKSHDVPTFAGCCSRGCMRFHQRRSAPAAKRVRQPPPVQKTVAAPRPVIHVDPPAPRDDMVLCSVCQKRAPDWATYSIDGKNVCCTCRPDYVARKLVRDDRATPGAPFEGDGVRVIRSTKGLS